MIASNNQNVIVIPEMDDDSYKRYEKLNTDIEDIKSDITSINNSVDGVKSDVNSISNSVDTLQSDIDSSITNINSDISAINSDLADLKDQSDKKIEYWFNNSANDPSLSWSNKNDHIKDLWYQTDTNKVLEYTYNNSTNKYSWSTDVSSEDAKMLQELAKSKSAADGKVTLYYANSEDEYPTDGVQNGDLLIDNSNGYNELKMCIGFNEYNNPIWEDVSNKYTTEVMNDIKGAKSLVIKTTATGTKYINGWQYGFSDDGDYGGAFTIFADKFKILQNNSDGTSNEQIPFSVDKRGIILNKPTTFFGSSTSYIDLQYFNETEIKLDTSNVETITNAGDAFHIKGKYDSNHKYWDLSTSCEYIDPFYGSYLYFTDKEPTILKCTLHNDKDEDKIIKLFYSYEYHDDIQDKDRGIKLMSKDINLPASSSVDLVIPVGFKMLLMFANFQSTADDIVAHIDSFQRYKIDNNYYDNILKSSFNNTLLMYKPTYLNGIDGSYIAYLYSKAINSFFNVKGLAVPSDYEDTNIIGGNVITSKVKAHKVVADLVSYNSISSPKGIIVDSFQVSGSLQRYSDTIDGSADEFVITPVDYSMGAVKLHSSGHYKFVFNGQLNIIVYEAKEYDSNDEATIVLAPITSLYNPVNHTYIPAKNQIMGAIVDIGNPLSVDQSQAYSDDVGYGKIFINNAYGNVFAVKVTNLKKDSKCKFLNVQLTFESNWVYLANINTDGTSTSDIIKAIPKYFGLYSKNVNKVVTTIHGTVNVVSAAQEGLTICSDDYDFNDYTS